MLFSTSDQQRLVPFFRDHLKPNLGSKAANQFIKAIEKPQTWLADAIIKPALFRQDPLGAVYYPVSLDPFSVGRNHHLAEQIATDPDPLGTFGGDPLTGMQFFANPLRLWAPMRNGDGKSHEACSEQPKGRLVWGDRQILTYEFDVRCVEFMGLRSRGGG